MHYLNISAYALVPVLLELKIGQVNSEPQFPFLNWMMSCYELHLFYRNLFFGVFFFFVVVCVSSFFTFNNPFYVCVCVCVFFYFFCCVSSVCTFKNPSDSKNSNDGVYCRNQSIWSTIMKTMKCVPCLFACLLLFFFNPCNKVSESPVSSAMSTKISSAGKESSYETECSKRSMEAEIPHRAIFVSSLICDRRKHLKFIKVLILYMGVSIHVVIKWQESLMKLNVLHQGCKS